MAKLLARVTRLRKHLSLAIVFSPAVGAMLVWILIAACWAGLLLLILHDATTEPSKKKWWRKDRRAQITPAELELTIAEAIRKNAPGCDSFIGVIVHHKKPRQHRDPNWGVRGVKFGKADRRIVDETLPRIVEQLRKEFRLVDPRLRN